MSDDLDWTNPETRRLVLTGMQSHLDDLHAVVKDMMRPMRKRQLGLREHKRIYRDARKGMLAAIERAMPPEEAAR